MRFLGGLLRVCVQGVKTLLGTRQKTKTFYRYAAVYFIVLFLLSGIILFTALSFSARRIVTLEERNIQNVLQRSVDILEKQYLALEGIATQITANPDYRPSVVNSGPVYDIALLKTFKQLSISSPLASQYFLVYNFSSKIYTSSGNTSYFDYYAPAVLHLPGERIPETLEQISEARFAYFDRFEETILVVFPLRIYGPNDPRAASLCFVMTEGQIKDYLSQMTVGLPEDYIISMGTDMFLSTAEAGDFPHNEKNTITAISAKGRFSILAEQLLTGWQELISNNPLLILTASVCVLLALGLALLLAKFSLWPLDQLIRKYLPEETKIKNEFRQLDAVLGNLDRQHSDVRRQLKDQLLLLLLRGEYSERLMERWALLDISLKRPNYCVFLIESEKLNRTAKEALRKDLEALSDDSACFYTVETAETGQCAVIANYNTGLTVDDLFAYFQPTLEKYSLQAFGGTPVDSPKRLPISFMSVLTAKQYKKPPNHLLLPGQADDLAEKLLAALETDDEKAEERACAAIAGFLSDEPLNGALTKHHIYELISSTLRKAEDRSMVIDKTNINALVLLPDTYMVIDDLKKILKNSVSLHRQSKPASDDTARLIVEYVIANAFDPDINLQDMSETFGLSADYISAMIKRETGSAFKEYVTMLRIGEARRLLSENKSLSVNDVALKVGYRKTSNFSKKFKELTGSLPSQI